MEGGESEHTGFVFFWGFPACAFLVKFFLVKFNFGEVVLVKSLFGESF